MKTATQKSLFLPNVSAKKLSPTFFFVGFFLATITMKEHMAYALVIKHLYESLAAAVVFSVIALSAHVLLEPVFQKTYAATAQFKTTQSIGSELSFLTAPSNVTMSPSIAGLTGGAATGSTQVVIYTNASAGYTMTITASGTVAAMKADTTGGYINDYTPAAGFPDFNFVNNSSGQASEFGFTVSASTTADLAQKFKDNGSACNTSTLDTGSASCWTYASSTATSTIVRTTPTLGSGSTSTIIFHTNVPASPSPALTEDTYVATTTLTAVTN